MAGLLDNWNPFGFLLLLLFSSCGVKSEKNSTVQIEEWQVSIPIENRHLSSYYKCDVYQSKGNDYFVGYNHTTHSFDFFDIGNARHIKSVQLHKEGPDGVPTVGSFAINEHYIATIHGNSSIYFLNHFGEILKKIDFEALPDASGLSLAPLELVFSNYSKNSLSDENVLLLPAFLSLKRLHHDLYSKLFLFEIQFDGIETDVRVTESDFPEEFTRGFFGDFDRPYLETVGKALVYNFPMSSTLYMLDEQRSKTKSLEATANGKKQIANPLNKASYGNMKVRKDYFFDSRRFFYLLHDKHRKLYYMVRKDKTDGFENKYKQSYLMVFDENFSFIEEIKLENSLMPTYFLTHDGLAFLYNQYSIESEDYLVFSMKSVSRNQGE